jgi:RNase P/RNase MRP subunit p29
MRNTGLSILASLLLLSLALTQVSCQVGDCMRGNGLAFVSERKTAPFYKLSINGGFEVYLIQGEQEYIKIKADKNLHEYIETDVRNGELIVSTERNICIDETEELTIVINYKDISEVGINGAVNLKTKNVIKTEDIKMVINGAANVELDIEAEQIFARVNGAANMDLSGEVYRADIDVTGAGNLDASNLQTEHFRINMSGAGHADLLVNDVLDASISGIGNIQYSGNPRVVNKDVSFLGFLSKK